jgi:GTP-binding protein
VVVFVVDGREGLNPVDAAIAERLRTARRPVVLAVNKLDDLERSTAQYDFYRLGFGDAHGVSAAVGKGSGDLLDAVVERLPPAAPDEAESTIAVAVVGRPNAGKSSLVNRLLGEERHLVAPDAGTTRDAIDSLLRYNGQSLNFIDTAGLRRRAKVEDDLEFYATLRTERAIERAQVCVLVVDATLGLHNQDLRIATQAWDHGCALIVVVNKWDLVDEKDANTAHRGQQALIEKAPFLRYVPFVYGSALTGQRVRRVLDLILEVADERARRVPTAEVNRVLTELLERNAPPQKPGEEVKLLYASQIAVAPPTFAIVSNRPDDVPDAYQRYLVHGFREAWPFAGSPVRLKFTARGSKR